MALRWGRVCRVPGEEAVPTEVVCAKGHVTGRKLQVFREFADRNGDARCWCGARQRIKVMEKYPNNPKRYEYEVVKIVRLLDDERAEDDGYDKMLVMSELKRKTVIKPMYWAKNRRGKWSYGQYPAAMEPDEWRMLFQKLGMAWVS